MAPALDWAASASEKKRNCCHYPRTSQTSDHIRHTTWNLHCCLLPRTFGNTQPVSPLSGTSDRYISASQLLLLMQTPLSPSKTIPCGTAFEIRTAFRNPGLTRWNGRFRPVDDATGLGADAAAEVLSRRLSPQPNPSSLSQLPKPVPVPLSLTPLQLLSTSPNPLNSSDPIFRSEFAP